MTAPPAVSTSLPAAVDRVIAELQGAGLQAAATLNELDAPGVLVTVPVISFRFGRCHSATFVLWAVVPALDRRTALAQLSTVLETMAVALGAPFADADADDIGPPSGGLLPAYRVEFTRRLDRP